ncbi:cilia- and flagella-associated protein 300-like isoform X3 [Sycon ciliatum]|uniref:cilia- and flagella-associated protein 300-like isoform X3 n=1 Tax=Sycon ciliatum TaxID=27933 RepID=UPI0031F62C99
MMEDGGGVGDVHYRFTPVAGGEKLEFLDKDTLQNLEQWGMLGGLRRHRFAYTGKFETYKAQDYFTEMVNSRDVQYALQVMSGASSGFCRLSSLGCQDAMHVAVKELSATVTDLTFFDRIADTDTGQCLISPSGTFKQPNIFDRMPDDPDSFDLVRMMLACDHSPHKDLYSMPERQELIFRIFYHLVLGGAICQYDESLQRYMSTTAAIYGKLVTPYKNPDSQDQRILLRAHAFELCVKADDGQCILPGTAPAADSLTLDLSDGGGTVSSPSFAYAIVEPLRKQVTVFSFDRRAGSWNDE